MDLDRDFDVFFKANERRIHYQIHRLGITGDWYDEFYAEGIFAMWKAYQKYEYDKGDIGTFVNFQIRFRLIDLMRKKLRTEESEAKVIEEGKLQLDNGNRHRGTGKPLVDDTDIVLENHEFWEEVKGRLTEKQWKWVEYYIIAGMTVKEIMELEDVTADAVKGWGRGVRSKLREDEELKRVLEGMM